MIYWLPFAILGVLTILLTLFFETKAGQWVKNAAMWIVIVLMILGLIIATFEATVHYISIAIHFIIGLFK